MSSTTPRRWYGDHGEGLLGQQFDHERMASNGSAALLQALWREHWPILEALEQQGAGRVVVRP